MKKSIISIAVLAVFITGCAGSSAPENTPVSVPADTGTAVEAKTAKRDIPLISINTKNADAGTDFVTQPINEYVSACIAAWTPDYVMPPAPYYEECTVTVTGTDGSVSVNNADAQVKVRGNWTTSYEKKPLRIKFAEKQPMLGLNGDKKFKNWVLLAEYKDFSMLRDKAALDMAKDILGKDGYYSSDCTLAEVEINGEYWGVYLLAEQQETNKNRVNVSKPEKDYTAPDIGYFLEYDGYFFLEDDLHRFTVDYADNAPLRPFDTRGGKTTICPLDREEDIGFTIKSDINSKEQHDTIAAYVNNVYDIMYAAAYEDKAMKMSDDYKTITEAKDMTPEGAVRAVVDVQSLADMYILSEMTCDADIYWSSFFMSADLSEDGNKKLTFEAPWDFDSALGNKDRCAEGSGFYAANIVYDVNNWYKTINPWLAVLMYEEWFTDIIKDKWTEVYDSGTFDRTLKMIESDTAAYRSAFERNYKRWDNITHPDAVINELCARSAAAKDQEQAAEWLCEWLETRADFMNSKWHK